VAGSGGKVALIVGAGLAGALMACYLARAGWRVRVYERRPDPRTKGYSGGRSINLALSARGLYGLAGVGLDRHILEHDAIPMRGRMIHPVSGPLAFQPYSADPGDAINSVSRGGLNITLLDLASRECGVEFVFDRPCLDVDMDTPAAIFEAPSGPERVAADLVIGADGAYSAVRVRLQKTDRFEFSQTYLEHGYKELAIPARQRDSETAKQGGTEATSFAMDPNALHIWPRGGAMMIALPNRDHSFTCTLFWPWDGEHGLTRLTTRDQVLDFFREHYPDAVPLMPTLADDFLRNANGSLVTVRCFPWVGGAGKVVLIGDAAHAIVPFYGQGMNCAFEDCRELARCLAEHPRDHAAALEEYQAHRKPNADAIADMAIENFVEMRDKVADPVFRYKKRLEQAVHQMFPALWTPQYNLVSFSTVPYTEARRRGRELDAVLETIIERIPASRAAAMSEEQWRAEVRRAVESRSGSADSRPRTQDLGLRTLTSLPTPAPGTRPAALLDITPTISARLAVWPGDTPLSREVLCDIAKGDSVTLSTLRATVHLGAHADGPNHYGLNAPDISRRRLEHYLGPCHVIEARVSSGQRITPHDLATPLTSIRRPRILLQTGTFPDPERWNSDFTALSVELVEALAAQGVITIGIDTPSVDLQDSKDVPAHKAILRHDIAILEGLVLRDVPPGEYELIALPLPLVGFDASPVRAVLRRLPEP
jgi:kynurenine 3-monooxygenase